MALSADALASSLSTLITPSYKITVEARCPEGEVACDNVKYVGVSTKTGKSITLVGKEIHTTSPDGTPGHFLGYEFNNGHTTYFIGEDGELQVTKGSKVLVEEHGKWKWWHPHEDSTIKHFQDFAGCISGVASAFGILAIRARRLLAVVFNHGIFRCITGYCRPKTA